MAFHIQDLALSHLQQSQSFYVGQFECVTEQTCNLILASYLKSHCALSQEEATEEAHEFVAQVSALVHYVGKFLMFALVEIFTIPWSMFK